jgi:O-antigen/teichoic acid export membrane protein
MRERKESRAAMLRTQIQSKLARNTLWMSMGQGLRLLVQAAFFTIIARSLGANYYGSFVGVAALVGILYPFGALGSGHLLVREVARDKRMFAAAWGDALATTTVFGTLLVGIVILLSRVALPHAIPARLVLLVAVADIPGLSLITVASQAFQAFEQLHWTAGINVLISSNRLIGALLLVLVHHHPTALQWGYVYLACTAVTASVASTLVYVRLGAPAFSRPKSAGALWTGSHFSISMSAQTIYNDIDKTMLARFSTLTATGIYGAAYRLIDVSFAPVLALLYAAYPRFFRAGDAGIASSFSYARPLLRRAVGYGIAIACGILLFAGLVPYVLGREYAETAVALRWLCPLPFLKAAHYFLADTLTGAGYQGLRSGIQAGVAGFNVAINLWLIPRYSWLGAAWSSIASDLLLALSVGTAVYVLSRPSRERRAEESFRRVPKVRADVLPLASRQSGE